MTSATDTGSTTILSTPGVNPSAQPVRPVGIHPAAELFPLMTEGN